MLSFFLVIFSLLNQAFPEDITALEKINLTKVNQSYRPKVFSSEKFNLYLTNGFCQNAFLEEEVNLSKLELKRNLAYYQKQIPITLQKLEKLMNEISPDLIVKETFYPLHIYLSLDGNQNCYNAKAEKNILEFPAHKDSNLMRANYDLIYHELGHVIKSYRTHFDNIFEEAFADALSLLLFDGMGVFYHEIEAEREEWRRQILLGQRDPHALAAELEIEYFNVPSWLKENELKYQCSSDEYYRDFRNSFSIENIFKGGGEQYIVSCAIHSYIKKLSPFYGHRDLLIKFVKSYLESPGIFSDISVPSILFQIFNDLRIYTFDSTLSNLILRKKDVDSNLTIKTNKNEIQILWKDNQVYTDKAILSLNNLGLGPISSYSLSSEDAGFYFIPKTKNQCESEGLDCICHIENYEFRFDFGLFENGVAKKISESITLSPSSKGCYEIGLLEETELVQDS